MKSGERKKHIFMTVVSAKNILIRLLALAMLLFLGWAMSKVTEGILKDKSKDVYKSQLGIHTTHTTSVFSAFKLPDISYGKIMSLNFPFMENKKEIKKKPAPILTNTVTPQKNPNPVTMPFEERSIVSQNLSLTNATSYKPDTGALLESETDYNATGDNAKVLIVHTHGCETYSTPQGAALGENGSYRTTDTKKNVTKVGEVLAQKLRKKGINVIHDKTLCDYPEYNKSYMTSLSLIEKILKENPSIEFVFDIHRDAIESKEGLPTKLTCTIDQKKCAQAMIVCGTDSMLEHKNWEKNLILGLKLQNQLEKDFPGLMRPLNLREERFNMHLTNGSLIIEIGTHANTLEEAQLCAGYLAEGIAKVIG